MTRRTGSTADAAARLNRPLVLVCEQDADAVRVIASTLEAAGFHARHAPAPLAAGDALSPRPDFALLEACGPGHDDAALARHLARAGVPFVVLSAHDGPPVADAVAAGAMGFFRKPLDVRLIIPSISAWIARAAELADLRSKQQSLQEALRHHRGIGVAVGVIMERHGLGVDDAFEALRRQARRERQRVATLASAIVAGTASLQPP